MTKHPYRVVGSTDVYSKKHIDRGLDRLDRLHDKSTARYRVLKGRVERLEALIYGFANIAPLLKTEEKKK